ncbi:hypothetical protein ABI59_18915 [Acidobacteria bacterium Mor1]|nr:hypothetical protein ABI59_18915 [Acidobacteria bacterium Mor1]
MSTATEGASVAAPVSKRDLFGVEALRWIPKILTLQDRNPHSPTYGCFDRNFWHYKIIDFPSGMSQEFVLPLALAHEADLPGNRFYKDPVIRECARAGIEYAARSAHADGSCDDYFPFEKAGGAAAFSLLAFLDSIEMLGLEVPELHPFLERRADWMAHHNESGRLTNHQALIVLCLEQIGRLLGTDKWKQSQALRQERVLEWQNEEGWFTEYEGADPGYHTLTVSLLARQYALKPDDQLKAAIEKAVRFAAHFVHPDGSSGGEYTSRNTYNYFPHGFELAGRWMPEALSINDRFLDGLATGKGPCYADDHIVGHHTWNYLYAWRDYVEDRPATTRPDESRVWFKNAGLLIDRREGCELILALNKGGTFKLFRDGELVISDTQFSALLDEGKGKNAVGHMVGQYALDVGDDKIAISGKLGYAKQQQMTSFKLMVLRGIMLSAGRFFPDLIRKLLQKMLITGKDDTPLAFERVLEWKDGGWEVRDRLTSEDWGKVRSLGLGGSQTSIYVVMSRTYQEGQLQPWQDLTERAKALSAGEALTLERRY